MKKLLKSQVYRDPIYGYINVEYQVIKDLINSNPFQRLRRIKQLSGVNMVYHGGEHSRFSHSVGVYELANRFLTNKELLNSLSSRQQLLFLVSALLHDIGHGAHSHAFEDIFLVNHELIGAEIITKNIELTTILDQIDKTFKFDIAGIILKTGKFPIIEQLISSQLDVDRLDYLERDSYFTGVTYGHVDVDRIIRVLSIRDNKVVFRESGLHAIENYLINRYHMYWQVYYHPVTRAYELILEMIYKRVRYLIETNYKFSENITHLRNIIINPNDLDTYLRFDDFYINGLINSFTDSHDDILSTLSKDFMNRNIWEYLDQTKENEPIIAQLKKTINNEYYYANRSVSQSTYKDNPKLVENILILLPDETIVALPKQSKIIEGLIKTGEKQDPKFFYRP